jgi:hypothetical protein
MIRCAICPYTTAPDPMCSALAILTVHWMIEHKELYLEGHPECRDLLADV